MFSIWRCWRQIKLSDSYFYYYFFIIIFIIIIVVTISNGVIVHSFLLAWDAAVLVKYFPMFFRKVGSQSKQWRLVTPQKKGVLKRTALNTSTRDVNVIANGADVLFCHLSIIDSYLCFPSGGQRGPFGVSGRWWPLYWSRNCVFCPCFRLWKWLPSGLHQLLGFDSDKQWHCDCLTDNNQNINTFSTIDYTMKHDKPVTKICILHIHAK